MIQTYLPSLVGGVMIGSSAILFLVMTGRIAGISGIVGRLAQGLACQSTGRSWSD